MHAPKFPLGAAALLGVAGLLMAAGGRSLVQSTSPATPVRPAPPEQTESAALGKKVFVDHCGKCHGENGAAPLAGGLPLSERKLTDEQIEKNVRGRLKASPEAEQRAVAAYIRSFQKKN